MRLLGRRIGPVLQLVALWSLFSVVPAALAVVVRGTVTDSLGSTVRGATVALMANGKVVSSAASRPDGSFQMTTSASGHFFLLVSGESLRQVQIPQFYASGFDTVEKNIVLAPEWVREQIVVTPTGSPLPQGQSSSSVDVLTPLDFQNHLDFVNSFRQIPGVAAVQQGQYGALTSVFVRGGNSDSNKVTYDGISGEDLGGRFDFGTVATSGVESVEVLRGPNSTLYGSDAAGGVIAYTTPKGTTNFPSLLYSGDGGRFTTFKNDVMLAGLRRKLDYLAGISRFDSENTVPGNRYHVVTTVGNFGWQFSGATSLRGTVRNSVSAVGVPGPFDFYRVSDDRKQADQDLFVTGTVENQTSSSWHNLLRYGAARKREQSLQWYPAGFPVVSTSYGFTSTNYYGSPVTIKGANGYSVRGSALLNYGTDSGSIYPNRLDLVSNRDQVFYQTDYKVNSHLLALFAFRYEDERALEKEPVYSIFYKQARVNRDFTFQLAGDLKQRFFFNLGGGIQKNQLFGTEGTPRIGLTYYIARPGAGAFHGTKLTFNFARGVKEPTLTEQIGSLYDFLGEQNGGAAAISQFRISPLQAPTVRSYDGGFEQSLFSERVIVRFRYFHNQYGRQVENVGYSIIPTLLPDLSKPEQQQLEALLKNSGAYSLALNSMDFLAQGTELEAQYGLGKYIFFRGGWTYLDAEVQHSFSSSALSPTYNTGLSTGSAPSFSSIPIGVYGPLRGARPFRRPPQSGFLTATYASSKFAASLTGAFVSRSDDSTFLGYMDLEQGNSLLLPNKDLDHGYASLGVGGSYQLNSWASWYAQATNLMNNQHIAPIGYPSLPFNVRSGLRLALGRRPK